MRETYTQFFDFPTEVQNLPSDEALVDLPPPTVRVQVEGEGIQLLRLYYNPPTVPIDADKEEIDLQVVTAEVAGNVRHESVVPASILLRKERRIERRIPVSSRLRLDMEPGYELIGSPLLSPDSVTVSGAVSVVNRMEYWPTVRQRLQSIRDTVRTRLALMDTLEGLVEVDAAQVALQANVVRFTSGSREISVRVIGGPARDSFTFEPQTTTATFNVPVFQYGEAQETADFYAYVKYEDIVNDTTGNVYASVSFPDELLLREVHIFPNAFRYYRNLQGVD